MSKKGNLTRKIIWNLPQLTPPCARAMAIIAATSITHDNGFHIKLKNLSILLSCKANNKIKFNKERQKLSKTEVSKEKTNKMTTITVKNKGLELFLTPFSPQACCVQTSPIAFEPHHCWDPLLCTLNSQKLLQ